MFIIYNIESTLIKRPVWYHKGYKTVGAAKAAMTRQNLSPTEYAISDSEIFFETIEKKVTKRNIQGGKEFEIGVNAPACVDPSTETYHSM
jgi:beta-galactosidase beta subunit